MHQQMHSIFAFTSSFFFAASRFSCSCVIIIVEMFERVVVSSLSPCLSLSLAHRLSHLVAASAYGRQDLFWA